MKNINIKIFVNPKKLCNKLELFFYFKKKPKNGLYTFCFNFQNLIVISHNLSS